MSLVVPPYDAAALASALDRLLADSSLRTSLADEGRRSVLERYGVERFVRAHEELYTSLLAHESAPRV